MDRSDFSRARNIAAVHFSMIALFLALVFWLYALGTKTPTLSDAAKTLTLSLFLLCAADNIRPPVRWHKRHPTLCASWDSVLVLVLLVLLSLLGLATLISSLPFFSIILVLGIAGFARSLYRYARWSPSPSPVSRLFVFLLAMWCAGIVWGKGFLNPRFMDVLTAGLAQKDTLFHMAITSMIKTYGIPSTGLHGTSYFPYHSGSHWHLVQLSRLLGVSIVWVYNLVFPVVFIPLLLASLFSAVLCIRGLHGTKSDDVSGAGFWGLFLIGAVGFVPYLPVMDRGVYMNLFNNEYIAVSESYGMGLTLGLLVLAPMVAFLRIHASDEERFQAGLWAVLVFPLAIGLVGLFKTSMGYILSGVWMYAILRWPWRQKPLLWISGACLVLVNYGLLRYCSFRAPFHWALWHFVRANIGITWVPYSLVLPSAWGLAFGVLMLYAREASSWGSIRKQWATNQLLEIELMGVIALASSAPSIFLALPGKTLDNFFINTQHWIGIVFLLGFLPIIRERLGAPGNPNAWRASTDLGKSLAGAAVGLILLTAALNAVGQFPGLLDDKRVLIQLSKSAPRRSTGAGMTCAQVLSVLQALDRLPREEKQMSRLYIPTGNRAYWDFFTLGTHRLDAGPFLAPALSGIAQVYGVPANTEIYYGYKIDIPDKSPETLQEVCATVRSQGARWAILFQDAPAQPLSRYDTEKDCL